MKKFTQIGSFKKFNEEIEVTVDDNTIQSSKIEKGDEVVDTNPKKFFSKLIESREMAQVYHWTVKGDMGSHASHLALESYYNEVIGFIDDMVEIYQGQYQLIEGYDIIDTTSTKTKEKLEYFEELAQFIKSERYKQISEKDTHIQNIIDEVLALVYKTIYKLKYNK